MKEMQYSDWCDLFANRCEVCSGTKFVKQNNVNRVCSCQLKATIKYRFEQIEVTPNSLKYKDWPDFTGVISDGGVIVGRLRIASALNARKKALGYCFSKPTIQATQNRDKYSIIHKHSSSGKNIIIAGDRFSGKTLLAALILKEVVWASAIRGLDLSFKWVKSSNFITAARWDNERPVDYDYLMYLQSIRFLAIDGIDNFSEYGHTGPPDIITMNSFFADRRMSGMPLILVCSLKFSRMLGDEKYHMDIKRTWGEDFLSLATDRNNVFIELEREA